MTLKDFIIDLFEYNQHFVAMINVINAARLNPHKVHAHWKLVDGRRVWYD